MPKMSCLVTDSGLHQVMARRYYDVYNPSQLITPADFQAMGFGIPTAIGVKLANPELLVVALVGDGGFLMSGMELMTAVREGINLIVIVFNDGKLGQIRLQQLSHFGRESAVNLGRIDYCMFAKSLDLNYIKYEQNIGGVINQLKDKQKVSLIEVKLADSLKTDVMRTKGLVRSRLLD